MSNTPHTLSDEFPGELDKIHSLKVSDAHFARILRDYDAINDQIHRAETNIEPVEQLVEVDLRKRRLRLKDEIASYLSKP